MKKYVQLITFTCMAIAAILVAGRVMKSRTTQATVVKVSSLTVESSVTCSGKVDVCRFEASIPLLLLLFRKFMWRSGSC